MAKRMRIMADRLDYPSEITVDLNVPLSPPFLIWRWPYEQEGVGKGAPPIRQRDILKVWAYAKDLEYLGAYLEAIDED